MDRAQEPDDFDEALEVDFDFEIGLRANSSSSRSLMSVWVFLPSRLRSSSAPMNLRCFSDFAGMTVSIARVVDRLQPPTDRLALAPANRRSTLQSPCFGA